VTEERFLSPQEIAEQLHVTDRAVLDLISSKKLPAVRIGKGRGVWRVSQSDFDAFMAQRRAEAGQEPATV